MCNLSIKLMCNLSIKLSLEFQNFSILATGSPFCFLKEIRSVSTVYAIMLVLEGFQLLDHLMVSRSFCTCLF